MPKFSTVTPTYPIYIPSKGRADYPITVRSLSHLRVPFNVIVEADQVEDYRRAVAYHGGYGTVLVLDPAYQRDYDPCMTLAPGQSPGSGAARNLIDTRLPFRWRGRYNEDTILSLDLLKAGYTTVLFNAWLQWKMPTGVLPGGNQTEIYAAGTLDKSRMLVREHPDVARLVWRYNRWHHHVDYRPFRNQRLIVRPDAKPVTYPTMTTRPRKVTRLREG